MPSALSKRIQSIDILRGIVMIIMALDHTRDFFHVSSFTGDPLDLATTTPFLFFTRWITHFCAPIFVFLSGISIYLQSQRKTKKELSAFLIKRGLWLIAVECIIVTFAWTFVPTYNLVAIGVIWAIGISMFILGFAIRLPFKIVLAIGLLIVAGHNLLDIPESAPGFKAGFWWDLLHSGNFTPYEFAPGHALLIVYAFLPWTGLMMLGYCAGVFFTPSFTPARRRKIFISIGISALLLFVVLRYTNIYGDPVAWTTQKNTLYSFLSFIKVNKYPPSLLYMCITVGIALLLLPLLEKFQNSVTRILVVFGRTAFFYYNIHLYVLHILCGIFFFTRGYSMQDAIDSLQNLPFLFQMPGEGYSLWIVYLVWICVVITLYPLCKWYDKYKTAHREKWWLSYL